MTKPRPIQSVAGQLLWQAPWRSSPGALPVEIIDDGQAATPAAQAEAGGGRHPLTPPRYAAAPPHRRPRGERRGPLDRAAALCYTPPQPLAAPGATPAPDTEARRPTTPESSHGDS